MIEFRKRCLNMGDRRSGNQNINSTNAFGDDCEELTCEWRGVKRLSAEYDNYELPLDHSIDIELGIIQTKGAHFNPIGGTWKQSFYNERFKDFDYLILYCANQSGTYIDRIYILPFWEEIIDMSGITITKSPMNKGTPIVPWYEKYRIKDEEIIKKINAIWKFIIERRLCHVQMDCK